MEYKRCPWVITPLEIEYHDSSWGKAKHDDKILFELIVLEIMQAGLSWRTILTKKEDIRQAIDNFNFNIIKDYDSKKIYFLMKDPRVIRNKLKLESLKYNAIAFLNLANKFGSFSNYIWGYTNNSSIINNHERLQDVPTKTKLSEQISKDMVKHGFKFIGPILIYSYMQSIGIVNDHMKWCHFHSN